MGGSNPALQAGLSHFALAGHPVGAKDNAGGARHKPDGGQRAYPVEVGRQPDGGEGKGRRGTEGGVWSSVLFG